jgi:hypothetical protein
MWDKRKILIVRMGSDRYGGGGQVGLVVDMVVDMVVVDIDMVEGLVEWDKG